MTDCPGQVIFQFHRRKAIVVADFNGDLISSDAGLWPIYRSTILR